MFYNSANESSNYLLFSRKWAIFFTTRNGEAPITYVADPDVIEVGDMTTQKLGSFWKRVCQLENEQGTENSTKALSISYLL